LQADAEVEHFLQRFEPRRREVPLPLKFLHRAVAGPRWDDHTALHAHVEGVPERLLGPIDSFFLVEKRRTNGRSISRNARHRWLISRGWLSMMTVWKELTKPAMRGQSPSGIACASKKLPAL
jgi:hypothetical protein